jgi:hypothetical protein
MPGLQTAIKTFRICLSCLSCLHCAAGTRDSFCQGVFCSAYPVTAPVILAHVAAPRSGSSPQAFFTFYALRFIFLSFFLLSALYSLLSLFHYSFFCFLFFVSYVLRFTFFFSLLSSLSSLLYIPISIPHKAHEYQVPEQAAPLG